MKLIILLALIVFLAGCVTSPEPYDYTNFLKHRPKSILVLPPLNESNEVAGTYGYLTSVSEPLGELGYYVFPVGVVDMFFKENGMPNAAEIQATPLEKLNEVYGADSVMYITLRQYGTDYKVITTQTTVKADISLIDSKTGLVLWSGTVEAQESSDDAGGGIVGMLVNAAVTQIIGQTTDRAHLVSRATNMQLHLPNHLLSGPYKIQE